MPDEVGARCDGPGVVRCVKTALAGRHLPRRDLASPQTVGRCCRYDARYAVGAPARAENIAIVKTRLRRVGRGVRAGQPDALGHSFWRSPRRARTSSSTPIRMARRGRWRCRRRCSGKSSRSWCATRARVSPATDSPGLGLGLPLIASLAENVQLGRDAEEHTEVRMTFSLLDAPHHYDDSGASTAANRSLPSSASAGRERGSIRPGRGAVPGHCFAALGQGTAGWAGSLPGRLDGASSRELPDGPAR